MRWSNFGPSVRLRWWLPACPFLLVLSVTLNWAQTPVPQTSPSQAAPGQASVTSQPAPAPVPSQNRPVIVIDPAHGGTESGGLLNPSILEKDVTLALARRLRQDFSARGIFAELLRDGDFNLSTDDRAAKVNFEHPALYICLHASSQPGAMRIFTAMLPEAGENEGPFKDWERAQSASLSLSRELEQQLLASIQKSGLSARALMTRLRPLNNVTVPALAIEIAPPSADVSQLMSPAYQQGVSATLAGAILTALGSLPKAGVSR